MQRKSCHGLSRMEEGKVDILEHSKCIADLRTKLRTTYDPLIHACKSDAI